MVDAKDFMINKIINEDGTNFDPPVTPEFKELEDKYPQCEHWGYSCMHCNKCMSGSYFKPADAKESKIMLMQAEAVQNYLFKHNPSIRERLSQ